MMTVTTKMRMISSQNHMGSLQRLTVSPTSNGTWMFIPKMVPSQLAGKKKHAPIVN